MKIVRPILLACLAALPFSMGGAALETPSRMSSISAHALVSVPVIAAAKKKTTRSTSAARKAAARRAAAAKSAAIQKISTQIGEASSDYLQQPGALIPFFEQLYRQENRLAESPVRILHFGDSHTAAHFWTSTLRDSFQSRFGNAGSGFIHAGKPWKGYRRFDVGSSASTGWKSEGLVGRASLRGDQFQGLSGVSIQARKAGEWVSLEANCASLEIQYLSQPGGGSFELYEDGVLLAAHSTDGELGPGVLELATTQGSHEFKIVTLNALPVKLYGWVAESLAGVTYEPLGISGANASINTRWDINTFQRFLTRRDPSLIVVAYGTNEAGQAAWTYEKYFEEFDGLLKKIRAAAPLASLLVVGPPDRLQYLRRRGWRNPSRMETVLKAQREAAKANRAAFFDLRERMGGEGSMKDWVKAGLAARDHVHFSADGYRRLGDVLYRDLMVQYNEFKKLRQEWTASSKHDNPPGIDPESHQESFQEE